MRLWVIPRANSGRGHHSSQRGWRSQMTKQQKWTPESPIEAWATTYESLSKALGGLQNKFEIPDAAREFVKRTAAAAKDGSTDLHAGANKVTGAIEKALVGAVDGMADVNRKVV